MIYFDTSYLIRLYIEDKGFSSVRERAMHHDIASAMHGRTETVAALHRGFREARLTKKASRVLLEQFQRDCTAEAFTWLPIADSVVERVENVFSNSSTKTFLRAADALHLSCAYEHNMRKIYSNDRHLLAAASLFGIEGINIFLNQSNG